MRIRNIRLWWGLAASVPVFVSGAVAVARQGPPPPPPPSLGGPLQGLNATQTQDFNRGRNQFLFTARPQDGLGPVFNGVSCVECHHAGAAGGASADLRVSRVTRIGAFVSGAYSDLEDVGGPLIQARALKEFNPRYPVPPEVVPGQAQFVAHRITTPLFGDGLIEAIPDEALIALSNRSQPDGIHGVLNMVVNPETGDTEIGRFGWKAQISTLHWFASDASVNEMGITDPLFPHENLPQGRPIPPGADNVADPEDTGGRVDAMANYMRYLAPPPSRIVNTRGQSIFNTIHCSACHVPTLQTGFSSIVALSNKPANLYSDLMLHHMGPVLADHIQQGQSLGDQFRTAPLWGLLRRPFWMHDGRATTLDQAIRMHGGESSASATRYGQLSQADRQALIQFLGGL